MEQVLVCVLILAVGMTGAWYFNSKRWRRRRRSRDSGWADAGSGGLFSGDSDGGGCGGGD